MFNKKTKLKLMQKISELLKIFTVVVDFHLR